MSINTPKKLKSDDYLRELQDQSGGVWLKSLIDRVVLSRTIPDKSFLDGIYEQFLTEHKLREKNSAAPVSTSTILPRTTVAIVGFTLKSLEHESGVNALEPGAIIPFHLKLTVVYGKNASGKSGFVRILKRAAGSKTQEEIWQNIHKCKTQNRCRAKIRYVNRS